MVQSQAETPLFPSLGGLGEPHRLESFGQVVLLGRRSYEISGGGGIEASSQHVAVEICQEIFVEKSSFLAERTSGSTAKEAEAMRALPARSKSVSSLWNRS